MSNLRNRDADIGNITLSQDQLQQIIDAASERAADRAADRAVARFQAAGLRVYGTNEQRDRLRCLTKRFSTLWQDQGFVNLPENEWIKLNLRNDWQDRLAKVLIRIKIYLLGLKDREVVNCIFDKLQ